MDEIKDEKTRGHVRSFWALLLISVYLIQEQINKIWKEDRFLHTER